MFEVGGKEVELRFPEPAIALDPLERGAHGRRIETRATHPPVALDLREAGALQHADVLRDSGQRHLEPRRQLADRAVTHRKAREDVAPCGIGEGEERGIERVGTVNHMV